VAEAAASYYNRAPTKQYVDARTIKQIYTIFLEMPSLMFCLQQYSEIPNKCFFVRSCVRNFAAGGAAGFKISLSLSLRLGQSGERRGGEGEEEISLSFGLKSCQISEYKYTNIGLF
jgi:hypothetical protein